MRQLQFLFTLILGSMIANAAMAQFADTILYNFGGGADGNQPYGRLIMDAQGALYGTTSGGSIASEGNVFKLTPPRQAGGPWTETVLYNFTGGLDGGTPYGALLFGPGGVLYGTASVGGSGCPGDGAGCGVVFELSPVGTTWKETVLYSFSGGDGNGDGYSPESELITDSAGALYGTTTFGGIQDYGTVFKLSPPQAGAAQWTESVLYQFKGKPDGGNPEVAVTFDKSGALYGTTLYGGASGLGAVFQLLPPTQAGAPWAESIIHNFPTGTEQGVRPSSALSIDTRGRLYGETGVNTSGISGGTVFDLSPPKTPGGKWRESILHYFNDFHGPISPSGGLVIGKKGVLYGSSLGGGGGAGGAGAVFSLTPPSAGQSAWAEATLHGFSVGSDGQSPNGVTMGKSGVLYGTTFAGGICSSSQSGCGTVFSVP